MVPLALTPSIRFRRLKLGRLMLSDYLDLSIGCRRRRRKRVMAPAGLTPSIRFKRRMEEGGELLPRMLDDITLQHISTKLSWRDVHVLSSVSPEWQQALQSRKIYDSRVDSYSTETFAVIPRIYSGNDWSPNIFFSLCSFRDRYFCDLSPFPFDTEWSEAPIFISLDRKIYVLGGRPRGNTHRCEIGEPNSSVYMLDLAEKQWKQCAGMSEPRRGNFAAAPLNGKIYVFGGLGFRVDNSNYSKVRSPVSACEVYDPKTDTWSLIKPIPSSRFNHQVAIMGDELFLHGGRVCHGSTSDKSEFATFLDIYHPIKDEWRQIVPSEECDWDFVFTARGNFHRMNPRGIQVYDIENDAWRVLHTFHDVPAWRDCPVALGDELFIEVLGPGFKKDFLQSKGFGSKNTAIKWKKVGSFCCSIDTWIPIQL